MSHRPRQACLAVFVALAGGMACISPAHAADDANTFQVFDSPGMNRVVHGHEHDLDLSAGPVGVGNAWAFFGVDDLSDSARHFLTSGVEWRSGAIEQNSLLSFGAMHTAARGSEIGSQTLMRAESRLDLGTRWYVPDLSLETDQLTRSADAGATLRARSTLVGLAQASDFGHYRLGYFRAGENFDAWGSSLAPGDRGFELAGQFDLASRWQLDNTLRMHDADIVTGTRHGLVDHWRVAAPDSPTALGQPWRLTGQVGDAGLVGGDDKTPLALELAARTHTFGQWQLDSAIGWYQGDITTPEGLPVDGGMWRLAMARGFEFAGLQTRVQPRLAVGGTRYANTLFGSRAGVGLSFPGLFDHLALNMDYASRGWSAEPGRGDVRMSLNITQNAAAFVPPLASMFGWIH